MKKLISATALALLSITATAQLNWQKGGNTTFPPGSPSTLGTNYNAPLGFLTNGVQRTRLNGAQTFLINSVPQNVSGYFGISPSSYFANNSPISMLHLYGPDNSGFGIGGGWRKWMSTGMFVNENSDAMYVGMKPETLTNRSDAVIAWNNDASPRKWLRIN
jgi:hypothetical protein